MTSPTNWPNPERLGVPMFPEWDGLHVFSMPDYPGFVAWEWIAKNAEYRAASYVGEVTYSPEEMAREYEYHAPCLTPAQISEILEAERERCAVKMDQNKQTVVDDCGNYDPATGVTEITSESANTEIEFYEMAAQTIRNLGAAP